MKTVITYGTFDVFHYGHLNLLKRARALGDFLIVGVTSEQYDRERGKLNVKNSLSDRMESVRETGLADKIIVEEYEGQKINDILKYKVDCFVIGSDWLGKFDYLKEFCEVAYLQRTRDISSTQIRDSFTPILNMGIIGSGRVARRFVHEISYVSGVNLVGIYNPNISSAESMAEEFELGFASGNLDYFSSQIDIVYIAAPHTTHYDYVFDMLNRGKHILCEKPLCFSLEQAYRLYELAAKKKRILLEAVKTAYCPAFERLVSFVKSGRIGKVLNLEASFTKLITNTSLREYDKSQGGGSFTELGSYVLLPAIKIFGCEYQDIKFFSHYDEKTKIDTFTCGNLVYNNGVCSFKTGIGGKAEGDLVISGTKGYIYVPAPWWKTEYFEIRHENIGETEKFFYKFEGEGLRYEISEMVSLINKNELYSNKFSPNQSVAVAAIIEEFLNGGKTVCLA
jgi:glycerol-3-phosphate cytidylyltransferase